METITYAQIEEYGFSVKLYNKFKRAGVNNVGDIAKFNLNRLVKSEVIELIKAFAVFQTTTDTIEEFGCSDALYSRLKKHDIEVVQQIPRIGYDKFSKAELLELFKEFAYFDSHQANEDDTE